MIIKIKRFRASICCLILFYSLVGTSTVFSKPNEIKVHNQPLEEVIKQLDEKSEYKIVLIGENNNSKISGTFYLTDIEQTLRRVLKATDSFIEFNYEEKVILINLPKSGPVNIYSGDYPTATGLDNIDIESGMTHDELLTMREHERQIQLRRKSDPNEVDLESGILYVDLIKMRENEKDEYLVRMSDPNEVDPESGLSYDGLLRKRENEKELYLTRISNPKELDPTTGMTYVAQMEMREREKKEYTARLQNPNEIDPSTGLSNAELLSRREN